MKRQGWVVILLCGLMFLVLALRWSRDPSPRIERLPPRSTPATILPSPSPIPPPQLSLSSSTTAATLRFDLRASAAMGIRETIFWLDTPEGRQGSHTSYSGQAQITQTIVITPSMLGLADRLQADGLLDYWWAIRTTDGQLVRQAATIYLPASMQAAAQRSQPSLPADWQWMAYDTPHVRFYYTPDSAAERDIDQLAIMAEASYTQASAVLSPALLPTQLGSQPLTLTIYLIPRVFWQGGVAYGHGQIAISYLDRNYTGVETWTYFVHEMIHGLAGKLAATPEIEVGNLLGEGMAVYGTGGHYQQEDLWARVAALERSGQLIDLCPLRLAWWDMQHETAYLEGASFVAYLIERYGLAAFLDHYLRQQPVMPGITDETFCQNFNQQIAQPFGISFGELEAGWRARIAAQPADPERDAEWAATVRFYDLMRDYEHAFDPAARELPNILTTWTITETLLHTQPATSTNAIVRELMLIAADEALQSQETTHANALLKELAASMESSAGLAGPLAQEWQTVLQLLHAYARALRTGHPVAPLVRAEFHPPEQLHLALLSDARIEALRLDVRGLTAQGVLELQHEALGQAASNRHLFAWTARKEHGRWQLATLTPTRLTHRQPPGPAAILGQ